MVRARPWLGSTLAGAASLFVIAIAPAARADDELSLDLGGATLELRRIPKGTFTQGSPANEPGRDKDEEPPRAVTITRDFWLAKVPVTRGQFARFASDARYVTEAEKGQSGGFGWDGKQLVQHKDYTWRSPGFPQGDDHPVVLVTYGDASAFAAWASRKTGKRVRLPTEAEYEYAARARSTTPWYGGGAVEDALSIGWFKTNAGAGTRPVAQKRPNGFGLFDMAGNVYEWCRDVYAPTYTPKVAIDPETTLHTGPEPERRVLRGGSWLKDPKRGRSAARFRSTPGSRNADYGFRVVVTEDDAIGPGTLGATTDFAAPAPLPLGSSSASPVTTAPPDGRQGAAAPPPPGGEGLGWLLFVAPVAAAGGVVAWMLARRGKATSTGPSGTSTRATDDGFFVRVPPVAPGTRVRYACVVNGTEVTDVVPLDVASGETFIYTGAPPTAIQILELLPPSAAGYRNAERRGPSVAVVSNDVEAEEEQTSPSPAAAVLVTSSSASRPPPPPSSPSPPAAEPEPFLGNPRAY